MYVEKYIIVCIIIMLKRLLLLSKTGSKIIRVQLSITQNYPMHFRALE